MLSLTEFGKHRLTNDGLAYQCKECNRIRSKAYRASPEGIFTTLKGQSKFFNRGEVNFSQEEFVEWYNAQTKECAYCDIPEELMHDVDDGWNNRTIRLTIDRIDNALSYEKGNIVLSCPRCNMIKSNYFTFDEMRQIGQTIIKPKWLAKITSKVKTNG